MSALAATEAAHPFDRGGCPAAGLTGDAFYRHQQIQQHAQPLHAGSDASNGGYGSDPHPDSGYLSPRHSQQHPLPDYSLLASQQSDMMQPHQHHPQHQQLHYRSQDHSYGSAPLHQQAQMHAALDMLAQQSGMSGLLGGMNGTLNGRLIGNQAQPGGLDTDQRKLVILGLPWDTTENTLHVRAPPTTHCT